MSITVIGDREVLERFGTLPEQARAGLRDSVGRMVLRLQRRVMRDKLSGQVLGVRTGRLRRSIDQVVVERSEEIVGVVSTNVRYGRLHEYGFSGTVSVQAHLRMITQAFGQSIAPRQVQVRTHARRVAMPERSFLRSSLHELTPDIVRDMRRSVGRGIGS